ncbi:tripartite tricarboxylate transporter TctB family protein [Pararhodobacter zhoushanensis]|uniref:tripartite tricarboxylate transporter TctB family protein n=1 Tax=Pararhodobacter zhoushanensis TaxID=2479545 RepID=UPI000F8D62B1|nr:tripartite tricarboxylate transporter TctB family protein [Pararhodobacter zhoushanensis]
MQRVLSFLEMFRRSRRPGDLIFALGFVALSAVLAALLPWQVRWLPRLPAPAQPAFWPTIGVAMMLGFGLLHLAATWVSPRLAGRREEVLLWLRSLEYVGWFVAYVVIVPLLGYLPATVLFAMTLSWRLGYRTGRTLGLAALFGLGTVLVFKAGLGVRIPAGALYSGLPDSIRSFAMSRL